MGYAARLAEPRVNAGVILASSELADEGCDQEGVQPFLDTIGGTAIRRVGRTQTLPGNLDDTTVITVMQ